MIDTTFDFLDEMHITKLKNVNDLQISFDRKKSITAIFGPNGCGKSTVLHALACVYQKNNSAKGDEYKFSDFFIPTNFGVWDGSKLQITYNSTKNKVYEKKKSRWTRYEDRPKREVYFIGIDICVPKIEREKKKSRITISKDSDSLKDKIVKDINWIMNRTYDELADCNQKKYKLAKVGDISYPSLFMGAGESKIIELVNLLHTASAGALILIDELDLTLHTLALIKFLKVMIRIAEEKKLQIIFTYHRDYILNNKELESKIDFKHIFNMEDKTQCFNGTTNKCIAQLTGEYPDKKVIYVEDSVSEEIVKRFLKNKKMLREYDITRFGSIDNSFTIACGLYLSNKDLFYKSFFVLDGDKYITNDDKLEQINKRYSGTECGIQENKQEILSHFVQYKSEDVNGKLLSPEHFIHTKILGSRDEESETYQRLLEIRGVHDNHQYLPLDSDYPHSVIIEDFSKTPAWDEYTIELCKISESTMK